MTALSRFFFRTPYLAPRPLAVIAWWESRRLAYNVSVGAAGLTTLTAVTLAELLVPHGHFVVIPWQLIVAYEVLANVAYCAGPALDLLIIRRWGPEYASVGPALFRYGYAFSMGLTLLPIPLVVIGWVVRALGAF